MSMKFQNHDFMTPESEQRNLNKKSILSYQLIISIISYCT